MVLPIFCNLSFFSKIYSINKYKVFDRNCMWLELSQFLKKKNTEGNARKLAVHFIDLITLTSQK